MKKFLISPILIFLVFLLSASVFGQAKAAFLKFDTANVSVNTGGSFSIDVIVDAGPDEITSTVANIVYDAGLLEAQSVTPGSFFPTVSNSITSGKVSISGLVSGPGTYLTGSGTLATITFKGLKNGTASLSFYCQPILYNSSKIIKNDLNATNVIDCSQNGSATIKVGSGVGVTEPPSGKTPGVTKPDDDDGEPDVTKIDDDKDRNVTKPDDDKDKKEGIAEKLARPLSIASLLILIAFVILILQRL